MKRVLIYSALLCLIASGVRAQTFSLFSRFDTARVSSATVSYSDTASQGATAFRFFLSTPYTTGTRYAKFDKEYPVTLPTPRGGILVDLMVPNWCDSVRVALSFCLDTVEVLNSPLYVITKGAYRRVYFQFPDTQRSFNRLRFALSYLPGRSGDYALFADRMCLVTPTDTMLFDGAESDVTPPDPSSNVTLSAPTSFSVVMTALIPANTDLLGGVAELSTNASFTNPTAKAFITSHAVRDSIVFTGLLSNTTYYGRVLYLDSAGNRSLYSATASVNTGTPLIPPNPPTALGIQKMELSAITFRFHSPSAIGNVEAVMVECSDDSTFPRERVVILYVPIFAPSTLHLGTFGGLTAGKTYYLQARSKGKDSSYSAYTPIVIARAVLTGVTALEGTAPHEFRLHQNYPNPFNPTTRIRFSVPSYGPVSVEVFDIQGKRIGILAEGMFAPGTYEAEFNAERLASGIYYCRMRAGSVVETAKMMYVR